MKGGEYFAAEFADRRVQRHLHARAHVLARDLEVQPVRRRHGVRAEAGAAAAADPLLAHRPHHQVVSKTR